MIGESERPASQPGSVRIGCERRGTPLAGVQIDADALPDGTRVAFAPAATSTLLPAHAEHHPDSAALAPYWKR